MRSLDFPREGWSETGDVGRARGQRAKEKQEIAIGLRYPLVPKSEPGPATRPPPHKGRISKTHFQEFPSLLLPRLAH